MLYEEQLEKKKEELKQLYGMEVPLHPATPFHYRNKMDFIAAYGKLGLRKRGKFADIVDIEECFLLPEFPYKRMKEIVLQLETYDPRMHQGILRYVTVRLAKNQLMIVLTVREKIPETEKVMNQLAEIATSVYLTVHAGKTDSTIGEIDSCMGKDHIIDTIAGKEFKIYPHTFFQANTEVMGELFTRAAEHAEGRVLDLCCGVGTISVIVNATIGVDNNPDNIRAAEQNAARNTVQCRFIREDMNKYFKQQQFDTIICDPARPGLQGAVQGILDVGPKKIIYISCNPKTHKKDWEFLKEKYNITILEAYDAFPQTDHVEIFSVFEKT